MTHVPVSSSILSAAHLAAFIQQQCQLPGHVTGRLLKAGVNHTYLITNETTNYVFRVYSLNWRTPAEIDAEVRLLLLLHQNDLPVSFPLADAGGVYVQRLTAPEGERFGVLFTFAAGEKLLTFGDELHYKLGTIMARFHQLTHNLTLNRVTYTPQELLIDALDKVRPFLPGDSEEMQYLQRAQEYMLTEWASINPADVRRGAVHLDIWSDNLTITPDGTVTLFDFDFCGNGLFALDIAYSIMQIHSTETDVTDYQRKKAQFLAGYESITPISDEEKRLIPVLAESVYTFYAGVQCERFENWSNVFMNELHLKRFVNLRLKRWFVANGIIL